MKSPQKISALPPAKFIGEVNFLCDQITAGMRGLERPHNMESYEELVIAILSVKAKEFSPYILQKDDK